MQQPEVSGRLITGINFAHRKVAHVYWQKPMHHCPDCNKLMSIPRKNARGDELYCSTCDKHIYDSVTAIHRLIRTHKRYHDYPQTLFVNAVAFEGKQSPICLHNDCSGEVAISLNSEQPRWTVNAICLDCGQQYDAKTHQQSHSRQNDELEYTTTHMSEASHIIQIGKRA